MVVQLHCVIKKKASVSEKKEFPHLTTQFSQGTEVTLVTEYVFHIQSSEVNRYPIQREEVNTLCISTSFNLKHHLNYSAHV